MNDENAYEEIFPMPADGNKGPDKTSDEDAFLDVFVYEDSKPGKLFISDILY